MQLLIYSACILFQNIIQAVTFRQSCSIEIVELPVFSVVQKKFENCGVHIKVRFGQDNS